METETPEPTQLPSDLPYDPANADAIAHALLVSPEALGTGWETTEEDTFDDRPASEVLSPNVPECADMITTFDASDALTAAHRAGRSQRKLATGANTPGELAVEQSINIFQDTETPVTVVASFASGIAPDAFLACFRGTLLEQFPPGSTVEGEVLTPSASLPVFGYTLAMRLVINTPDESAVLTFETYNWQFGNAGIGISVTGSEAVDGAAVQGVIDALQANLDDAAVLDVEPTPDSTLLFDPADAESIAEFAMPDPAELPGQAEWTIADEDDFGAGPFDDLADDPSCDTVAGAVGPSQAALLSTVAGRSSMELQDFDDDGEFLAGTIGAVDVAVHETDEGLRDIISTFDEALESDEYLACVTATLQQGFPGAPIERVEATLRAPEDGASFALTAGIGDGETPRDVRLEFYAWSIGNAVVSVRIVAPTDVFSSEVVEALISGTVDRLAELAQ